LRCVIDKADELLSPARPLCTIAKDKIRMKFYLHKEILKEIKLPIGMLLVGIIWITISGLEFANTLWTSISFLLIGMVILKLLRHRKEKTYFKNSYDKPVLIESSSIVFPMGYYFKYSNLNETRRLESFEIAECCINTLPISFVTHDNEVIFVPHISEEDIRNFCKQDKIPISNRIDIWERINWPFLDTEFEEHEVKTNENLLDSLGIDNNDLKEIRKKISPTMSMNYFAWEWNYLGQFDYLRWTRLTKEKYWWSMEIALRNFKSNCA
jgi:hypothetical protein